MNVRVTHETREGSEKVLHGEIDGIKFRAREYWASRGSTNSTWHASLEGIKMYEVTKGQRIAIGKACRAYEKLPRSQRNIILENKSL